MMSTNTARPSEQVLLQRVRNQLIDYLEVASSFAEQQRYQLKSPQLQAPLEIIEQWADWVGPNWRDHFKAPVFSAAELDAVERFQRMWSSLSKLLPQPLPTIELIQKDPIWEELRVAAATTYACFLRVGKLSETTEYVPATLGSETAVVAGVMVYAKDAEKLKQFYMAVLHLSADEAQSDNANGYFVLEGRGLQLVVHAIPATYAAEIEILVPPAVREDCALKFFYQVHDINHARDVAAELGGNVDLQVWETSAYIYCNGFDPEGNVFQLRQAQIASNPS